MYSPSDWERRRELEHSIQLPAEDYRTEARRDAARLIHSPAFRRLQGKTQLFPGIESDYFRNRLTHSLEVGQIAKSIAIRLNHTQPELPAEARLDTDLVEFAGWCHDLGHPPFGHQGELALDDLMKDAGGFEGNAQTLRIITKLEKRQHFCDDDSGIDSAGLDCRLGLNLTARTIASILKYDRQIPSSSADRNPLGKVCKGYYVTESDVVNWVRQQVIPGSNRKLKTVECQIMDIADDIAYSTYDLEDTFKAGFFGPLDMITAAGRFDEVAQKTAKAMQANGFAVAVAPEDVLQVIVDLFGGITDDLPPTTTPIESAAFIYGVSSRLMSSGYLRSALTSSMIRFALEGVQFAYDPAHPVLSVVSLSQDARLRVEVLKHFTYEATIQSPRVTVSQFRANEIIATIFKALTDDPRLLPDDVHQVYNRVQNGKKRVLSDFIAGMTDRYALEFYGRFKSENPQTIFKPL